MRRINLFIATLLIAAGAFAQDDKLDAIIEVENEYNPVETKATKQSFTPKIAIAKEETPLGLVFSQKATPYTQFVGERNVKEAMPKQETEFPGYARLGYGNNNNIDAKVGYRTTFSKRDYLSAIASFDGFKTKMKGIYNNWDSRMFDTKIKADYMHRFNILDIGVSVGASNRAFNYQKHSLAAGGSDKQQSNRVSALLNAKSNFTGPLSFDIRAGYNMNSRRYVNGVHNMLIEHNITGDGTVSYEIISKMVQNAGLTFDVDGFLYNKNLRDNIASNYRDYVSIRLNPYANFIFGGWKMRAGLHLDMHTTHRGFLAVAPDCSIHGYINNLVSIYGSITGGRTANSFGTLEELSPYWDYSHIGSSRIVPTYRIVDVKAGARFNVEPFTVNFYAGYAFTQDDILAKEGYDIIGSHTITEFGQYNTNNVHVGTRLACDYAGWFNIYADARYDFWSSNANKNWLKYKPEFTVEACAEARIFKDFYANVSYNFVSYTKGDAARIPFTNNLSAKISYDFLKRYSVFVKGSNLINSKYFIFPGYYAQGVNIIAGASINF